MPPTRPGPLQDLPIEYFRSPAPSSHPASRPLKRPLSPGPLGPFGHSPTKRRLVNDEGTNHHEKDSGRSIPPSYGTTSPSRFSEAVQRHGSPAKKQDNGSAKQDINTSCHDNVLNTSKPSTDTSLDYTKDYFPLPQRQAAPSSSSAPGDSCHYPGFQVYVDPHSPTPGSSDNSTPPYDPHLEKEVDEFKENRPPVWKLSPATQAHLGLVPLPKAMGGDAAQEKSYSMSPPSKINIVDVDNDVQMVDVDETPRHNRIFFSRNVRTPNSSSVTRKALRQLMEDEIDIGEEEEAD
ncbi:hypothetical protein BDN72DRAFT_837164 [Pluteus cervinus]|uniref:Uncharacterized protein n=1 Tax=Pluteus cervinus TaxID=181527 RepID=A0ACD3B2G1_9AGAR|nr:hypothetical protein BDN72DRAFT_837164 [Pluteus cervinus]